MDLLGVAQLISTAWDLYQSYSANQEREDLLAELRALRGQLEELKSVATREQINQIAKLERAVDSCARLPAGAKLKPAGQCPFCKERVRAGVIETNVLRRDKCRCPRCGEIVYVCRTLGCDNYAQSGTFWDDEFCPACAATPFGL